jgi:hypothetical protein
LLTLSCGSKLDCDRIDDWQIISIFFTDSPTEVRGRVVMQKEEDGSEHFLPGKICALYGFNFLDYHQECRGIYGVGLEMAVKKMEEDKEHEAQEALEKLAILTP